MSRYVVLLGAPGAGKGTQALGLARDLGLVHVASGDLFREHLQRGTELGRLAKGYLDRGELVPDDVTVPMVLERLRQPDVACGAVLDGFPRTLPQAQALDAALKADGKRIAAAVLIDVSREELLRRLGGRWLCPTCQAPFRTTPEGIVGACGRTGEPTMVDTATMRVAACGQEAYQRPDDSLETAQRRLDVYFERTMPLMDYYEAAGKLQRVAGEGSIEDVGAALLAAVRQLSG